MKQEYELKMIDYMRGKTTAFTVSNMAGVVFVPSGVTIGDAEIQKAKDGGVFHYLFLSAAASVIEAGGDSARERLAEFQDITEGHEADFVAGKKSPRNVMDFQNNIIVREGEVITSEIIEKARNRGVLQEIVLAVGAPGFFMNEEEDQDLTEDIAEEMGYAPYTGE